MAPLLAARRRWGRTSERRLCASVETWLLALAHDACRRRLEKLARPVVDDRRPERPTTAATRRPACNEVCFAISRQLDGRLSRREARALRNHIGRCADCARLAEAQRAQRAALRELAEIPVPRSLQTFFL
jgi:Putative zinc-finger